MSENFENKASLTTVKNFSQAGADKLREMTENSETYIEFLKFQGRVFKHNTSVLQYFEKSGYTLEKHGENYYVKEFWINVNKVDRKMSKKVQIKLISA